MICHGSSGILVFLPGVQLVSKRIQHRYGFVRMVQQPLHTLKAAVRVIVLHGVDFARAVRRYVALYRLTVKTVQPRNSLEVFIHGRSSSRAPFIQAPLKHKIPPGLPQQRFAQRGRHVNAAALMRLALGHSRSLCAAQNVRSKR